MAQHDYIISNATFPAVRTDINNALSAIQTTNSGTSRPTGAVAGQLWLDTTSATTPTLKYYDGADDISLATIDHTANTVNWLDSTVSITGLSTTATGTVLTLSDSASTSTVNLIIDNQKEIRFRETTANGTNYIALKAPASVTADLTFTLPVAPTVNNQALISSTAGVMSFTPYTFPTSDGTINQTLITNGSGALSFSTINAGTSWQSVQTSGFTAVAGKGYPCNTTSSAFTVTLPASPSVGDYVQIVDYAGTFATNNLTITSTLKINGSNNDVKLTTNREATTLVYVDSTQGWLASSGVNEGTSPSLTNVPSSYSVDFLVIAGGAGGGRSQNANGGAGGGGAGGYRNSYSTETSGGGGSSEASLTFTQSTIYTITVGAGGNGSTSNNTNGSAGSNSEISGTGITTITSTGGGGGGGSYGSTGSSGGSGGGGGQGGTGGSGTANQGYSGGTNTTNTNAAHAGGGAGGTGGASTTTNVAGIGGVGLSSSITGSSVGRGGGGGGGGFGGAGGTASNGGGAGGDVSNNGVNGTSNTGGGGGGGGGNVAGNGGNGGKGVVILRMPDENYSGTTTGSPTVTTGVGGTDTVIVFNDSGTYTG